jgi:hypothetical protein
VCVEGDRERDHRYRERERDLDKDPERQQVRAQRFGRVVNERRHIVVILRGSGAESAAV